MNMQRKNPVGKTILNNLRSTATQIGSSKPFYTLDPNKYCYVDTRTTPMYLWSVSYKHGIHFQILEVGIPQPKDKNKIDTLMDIAVYHLKYKENKIKVKAIIVCCLNHGII